MKTDWCIGFAQQLSSFQTAKTLCLHFILSSLSSNPCALFTPSGSVVIAIGISFHTLVWPSQTSKMGRSLSVERCLKKQRGLGALDSWIPDVLQAVLAQSTSPASARKITLIGCFSIYKAPFPIHWRSGFPLPYPSDYLAPTATAWYLCFSQTLSCFNAQSFQFSAQPKARLCYLSSSSPFQRTKRNIWEAESGQCSLSMEGKDQGALKFVVKQQGWLLLLSHRELTLWLNEIP